MSRAKSGGQPPPDTDFARLVGNTLPSTYYEAGDVIFEKGVLGREMFVVRSGEVRLMDDDKVLCTIGDGEIFGEMALIDGSPRSATASTRTGCLLSPINERAFLFLVRETPRFALEVMRVLATRIRTMNETQ